ncbi:hypothetical protein CO046_00730 [Candidatus Peregrinibacteria bacterium CG_4_9_14_0_2_um_filter_53_11]|nr:MAG: hypothetical protein CO046_00730 [Candidatus Peregrinibacteria bacterium CG_4_9_14_0_2_um_filter_53_11]
MKLFRHWRSSALSIKKKLEAPPPGGSDSGDGSVRDSLSKEKPNWGPRTNPADALDSFKRQMLDTKRVDPLEHRDQLKPIPARKEVYERVIAELRLYQEQQLGSLMQRPEAGMRALHYSDMLKNLASAFVYRGLAENATEQKVHELFKEQIAWFKEYLVEGSADALDWDVTDWNPDGKLSPELEQRQLPASRKGLAVSTLAAIDKAIIEVFTKELDDDDYNKQKVGFLTSPELRSFYRDYAVNRGVVEDRSVEEIVKQYRLDLEESLADSMNPGYRKDAIDELRDNSALNAYIARQTVELAAAVR